MMVEWFYLYFKYIKLFESFPELTDIIGGFVNGEWACPSAGWSDAAWIARVPDVGDVGGDGRATVGWWDHTADPEPESAGSFGRAWLTSALRGGEACSQGGGGTAASAGAFLIWKMDYAEQWYLL